MPNTKSARKVSRQSQLKATEASFPPKLANVDDLEMRVVTQHFVSIMRNKSLSFETQSALSSFIHSLARDVGYFNPVIIEAVYPIIFNAAFMNGLEPRGPIGPIRGTLVP
jgi:hypothetical protein